MLITKNVFLDTSVLIAHHFDYSSVQLSRLGELAQQGDAHLVTTPIVVAEVESNIRKRVEHIAAELKRFKKDHRIAKNFTTAALKPVSHAFDAVSAHRELTAQFYDYMKRTGTELVRLELSSAAEVFDWYFKQLPPFGGGEKKHEFPDAFTVSTLEKWCGQRREKLYVVTGDGDLAKYCDTSRNLIRLRRPAEFIDGFLRRTTTMRLVEDSASKNLERVRDIVGEQFGELGFYLDDEEGDVDEVEVKGVEIEELSLLDVADSAARFEALVQVQFEANVSYPDMETSVWDSEDGISIPLRTIRTKVTRDFRAAVILSIRIDGNGEFHSVTGVEFPVADVPISVDRYNQH